MQEDALQGQPVRSLQIMLRDLSFFYPNLLPVLPNGAFGEKTREAVRAFQREFHLPVTGVVDNAVWDAVVLAWTAVRRRTGTRRSPSGFSGAPGQTPVGLLLSQALFQALSAVLEGIEPAPVNGSHGAASVRNVRWLQRAGGLRESGVLGKAEWDLLVRLYTLFLLRGGRGNRRFSGPENAARPNLPDLSKE